MEYLLLVLLVIIAKYEILLNPSISLQVWIPNLNVNRHHTAERVGKILHLSRPSCTPHESLTIGSHLV